MIPLTKTITAVLFLGLFTISLACEAKTNTKGKFHLIYLVSAEKLKVGAKVFVEPLFLTNGDKIESVYGYCRGKVDLSTTEMSKPTAYVLGTYCVNKSFNIPSSSLYAINNFGISVNLGTTIFLESKKNIGSDILDMPASGITKIVKIKYMKSQSGHKAIRHKYPVSFLASDTDNILRKIVPISNKDDHKVTKLQYREKKYRASIVGYSRSFGHKKKSKLDNRFIKSNINSNLMLYGDFDGDSLTDIAVVYKATANKKYKKQKLLWSGFSLIYGNEKNEFFASIYYTNRYLKEDKKSRKYYGYYPHIFIKTNKCRYILFNMGPGYEYTAFLNTTKTEGNCHERSFEKFHDPTLYN